MNQSFHSFNLLEKYQICRQQSQCYRLIPPPRLPIFPKVTFVNSSSTLRNLRQHTDSCFIIPGIFIGLISICLLLFLLGFKFQFYHKIRQRCRQTKNTNTNNRSASFLPVIPTYDSLTPLTIVTNQSPPTNKFNLDLNSDNRSLYDNYLTNIYERIGLPSNHHHCSCCSCTLAYYQQNQYSYIRRQLTPSYYTCVSSPSNIMCQNSLSGKLPCKQQQCLCHNFFVPIK